MACVEFGKIIRDKNFRDKIPNFKNIELKLHLIEAHLYSFASKWKMTGSFSECSIESLHHDVNLTTTDPKKFIEQQLNHNLIATTDTIIILTQTKERKKYLCKKCFEHNLKVIKTDHICPYK